MIRFRDLNSQPTDLKKKLEGNANVKYPEGEYTINETYEMEEIIYKKIQNI